MKKLSDFLEQPPPELIFHYSSASGALGILKSGTIWASSVYHLNDSREFRYAVSLLAERLSARMKADSIPKASDQDLLAQLNDMTLGMQAYVCSFSTEGDLLSQWLAYSGTGNGYALAFCKGDLSFARSTGYKLIRCVYNESEQLALADLIVDVFSDHFANNYGDERLGELMDAIAAACAIKHPGFKNEAEWRLVKAIPIGWGMSKGVQFRSGRNGIVPYLAPPIVGPDQTFHPQLVHVGPSSDVEAAMLAMRTYIDSLDEAVWPTQVKKRVIPSKTPYRP